MYLHVSVSKTLIYENPILYILGLSHEGVLYQYVLLFQNLPRKVYKDIQGQTTLSVLYNYARLTSFRSELCSWIKSLWRVWTEAVAVFFREWRELRIWVRGSIIWQTQKKRGGGANNQCTKTRKDTFIHTKTSFKLLITKIVWGFVVFMQGVCYMILIRAVYTCSNQQGAVWPPYVRRMLFM